MVKKILIAEQDEDDRKLFTDLLKDIGYETLETKDLQNVQALALTNSPDLIILSEYAQEKDIAEITQALKDNDDTNYIPLLLILDKETTSQKENLRRIGVEDFIFRPFPIVAFLKKVQEMLTE